MPDESTAVTAADAVSDSRHDDGESFGPPCGSCGLRNPSGRRSCLACGAPLGHDDDLPGPLPIDPPLLEREAETRAIDQAVARFVTSGEGGVIAIEAPRGHGTTRLLRHAAERLLAAGGVRILSTTVRESDGPYPPMTRLLWDRFGVTPAKGPQTARGEMIAEVNRELGASGGVSGETARRIVVAAGLPAKEAAGEASSVGQQVTLERIADSSARFLTADAASQPIALLVDNLHVVTDDGAALFRAVIDALGNARVLVVAAGEHDLARMLGPRAQFLRPATLSRDACESLCHSLLPGLTLVPDELLQSVLARAGDTPGRVREILHALIESRVIIADEVPWRTDPDALGPSGPISSEELLQVRISRLDSEARAVLSRAAIVGEVFWEGSVAAMTRVEEGDGDPFDHDAVGPRVQNALRRLVAAELIAQIEESELAQEREYAFAVAGLREMVLQEQDEATRRPRHDVCASWLELAAGSRSDDLARAIAGHLERAGLADAAARAYLRAAKAARQSYRGPLATQLYDKALGLLPRGDGPTRIEALHDKGVVLSLLGRIDDAGDAFLQMLALANRYGARSKMAAALGRLGRLAAGRGELQRAQQLLWRALELFQQAEDQRGVAAVQDDLGQIAFLGGDFDSAVAHSTQALEIRRELEDIVGEALSTHNLGLVHRARGQPRQARAHWERALALREKYGDVEGAVKTRNALAVLAYERGDILQAEAIWGEIVEMAQTLGDRRMTVIATHNLGEAALMRSDTTRASQLLDQAEQLAAAIDDKRSIAEVERTRGALARLAGDGHRARAHLERSLGIAQSLGVREAEALALRGLGEVCAMTVFDHSGQLAREAEAYFHEATRILEDLGATRELARTRSIFGQYLIERGEVMNGRRVLTMAVPVLEQLELAEAAPARMALNAAGGEVVVLGT